MERRRPKLRMLRPAAERRKLRLRDGRPGAAFLFVALVRGTASGKERKAMSYKVAVVGATGNVGREMLEVLASRAFPVKEVAAVASSRSAGSEVPFGEEDA